MMTETRACEMCGDTFPWSDQLRELAEVEAEIDRRVDRLYGLSVANEPEPGRFCDRCSIVVRYGRSA